MEVLKADHDEDETAEEEDEEEEDNTRDTSKKSTKNNPHCTINYTKNTPYQFLAADSDTKIWAEAILTDPAPKVPPSRADATQAGDYVLVTGNDLKLKKTSRGACTTSFEPGEELVLTADWVQFDEDMTGQDLLDLGDITFLLWWQNIKPPKEKARTTIPKKKPAPAKKKTKR